MKSNLIDDIVGGSRPEILRANDPLFDDMLRYMEWASEGFAHCFAIEIGFNSEDEAHLFEEAFRV